MKKNIEWLKKEIEEVLYSAHLRGEHTAMQSNAMYDEIVSKIDQLDKPEVLSQEENINIVLDDLKEHIKEQQTLSQNVGLAHTSAGNDTHYRQYDYVLECINEYEPSEDLQNLLVPKQEEVDRAYKDGYEEGKQHTFYKGYLEGLADKEKEPETVADVIANFYKSLERLKEVLGTEVEEPKE